MDGNVIRDSAAIGHRKIENAARDRLASSGYYALRRVSCELQDNVLTLMGEVPSYYEKQVAQSVVQEALGAGLTLANQLQVTGMS